MGSETVGGVEELLQFQAGAVVARMRRDGQQLWSAMFGLEDRIPAGALRPAWRGQQRYLPLP